jgi:hypothetical protein
VNLYLISKLYFKSLTQLPHFLSGILVVWFNFQQYKKVRILIFIILNILTKAELGISKKKTKYFFYSNVTLSSILNFINLYLSNVDITLSSLLLNKGLDTIGVQFAYSKLPLFPELNNFFEQVVSLLQYLENTIFSIQLYIHTIALIGGETYLRALKLPVFLSK